MSEDITSVFLLIDGNLSKYKKEFADEFLKRVKQRTPVDTGTLQGAWTATFEDKSVTIENDTPYAGYVEMGTVHHSPVGMLRTTVAEAENISEVAKERAGLK